MLPRLPVWIDTDVAVQQDVCAEIDDGYALVQAYNSPELDIHGISTVFGNAPGETTYRICFELTALYRPDLQVYRGADEPGVIAPLGPLAEALEREPLTIIALGPLTNIAALLRTYPQLKERVVKIIAVAGRLPGQRFSVSPFARPLTDFNFELDPEAFRAVLESQIELVLTPWEAAMNVWLDSADLDWLESADPSLSWLIGPSRVWLASWRTQFGRAGFMPFDTLAVSYAIAHQMLRSGPKSMSIEEAPDDASTDGLANKPYLIAHDREQPGAKATWCFNVRPDFKQWLLRRLTEPSTSAGTPA